MDPLEKAAGQTARFLSFRPRSEHEVRIFLKKKEVDPQTVDKVVNMFKQNKFIDDHKFAMWWIDQRLSFRPMSMRLLKMELKSKGIADEIVFSSIKRIEEEKQIVVSDIAQAERIVAQKQKRYLSLPSQEQFKKLAGLLTRRGFSYETIKKVLPKSDTSSGIDEE